MGRSASRASANGTPAAGEALSERPFVFGRVDTRSPFGDKTLSSRRIVAIVIRGLLVTAGVVPFLPALFARVAPSVTSVLDAWFRFQCERDPARMLAFGAVCARCLGLYVGLGSGALIARPRLATRRLELWLLAGAVAMLLDVGSEWLGWRPAWAPLRFATGLSLAYPAGIAIVAALGALSRPDTNAEP